MAVHSKEGMLDWTSEELQMWLDMEGAVGKEVTPMECQSEEFDFHPDGNGEPWKNCKQ